MLVGDETAQDEEAASKAEAEAEGEAEVETPSGEEVEAAVHAVVYSAVDAVLTEMAPRVAARRMAAYSPTGVPLFSA